MKKIEFLKMCLVLILFQVIFLFILFSSLLSARTNDLTFERFTRENGFPLGNVYAIIQDSRGFMWFGGDGPLIRYDGHCFKEYQNDPADPSSLAINDVCDLFKDEKGVLWCATWGGGLCRYDPASETFRTYKHDPNDPFSIGDNRVQFIYQAADKELWFGAFGGGLNHYDPERDRFTVFKHDPDDPYSLSDNRIWCMVEDQSGNLWIATGTGLNKFDRVSQKFTHYMHDPNNPESVSHNQVRWLFIDSEGTFWVSTRGGLDQFKPQSGTFIHYKHNQDDWGNNYPFKILEDQAGTLWVATRTSGLNIVDRKTKKFHVYGNDPTDSATISHNDIRSLCETRQGILWIGTRGGSVNKLDLKPPKFRHYKHIPTDPDSLSNNDILSFHEDSSGVLWIGTEKGLNRFDRQKEIFHHFRDDPDAPARLSNESIWSIREEGPGFLWIVTEGDYDLYDRAKREFIPFKLDPKIQNNLTQNLVTSLYPDSTGILWVTTFGQGLYKYDRQNGHFIHFKQTEKKDASLNDNYILAIYEDESGDLWLGTRGGLSKYDRHREQFIHYQHDRCNPHSLSDNNVFSLCQDHEGTLWVGTGNGLNKFDHQTGQFVRYTTRSGLPDDDIVGILEEDESSLSSTRHLWISTLNGLSKFNPKTETFQNYDYRDGLQSNMFRERASCKSRTGEMFFGGVNGFNAFYPHEVKHNTHRPPIVFTDFKLANKSLIPGRHPLLNKSITETSRIVLSYRDKIFSLDFAALDYTCPEKNRYKYKMEGFEDEWVDAGSKHSATYTNLDPGRYVFRVRGSNNDGIWNETGASLVITITPPPWLTWYAYCLYCAAGLGILLVIYYRIKKKHAAELEAEQLRIAKEEAEKATQSKSNFLASMSHEIRTPMNAILGLSNLALKTELQPKHQDYFEKIRVSAHSLLGIINDILDFSKIEAGKLDLESVPFVIRDEIKKVSDTLAFKAYEQGVEHLYLIDEDIPTTLVGDPLRIQQILMNLANNALKFTDAGEVLIKVVTSQKEDNKTKLTFSVRDTGIGIGPEQLSTIFESFTQADKATARHYGGSGLGLNICRCLVEMMNGRIWAVSEPGRGSTFYFEAEFSYLARVYYETPHI
ncbi:two-component regulator propeller domain-containing protein [candidate division CSSED10-310 bacterium]|uniref:histidine kinase n=1 Tax=candidate division CSSED10-310 bacterium TaxID=2855610 RepID=A0ABV6YUK1_UNCC1